MVRKSDSAASRSAVNAAEGTSIITPTCSGPDACLARLDFLPRLGQHASRLAQLLDARHERKHHAKIAVRGRAHQRPQLRAQQLAALQRESNRSQPEAAARHLVSARPQRVAPMLAAGELILVDVECAHRHRGGPHILEQLPVHLVLHVLGQLVCRTAGKQQLRSKEPDAFRALRHRKRRIAEQIDVRLDANVHAVGGVQRLERTSADRCGDHRPVVRRRA